MDVCFERGRSSSEFLKLFKGIKNHAAPPRKNHCTPPNKSRECGEHPAPQPKNPPSSDVVKKSEPSRDHAAHKTQNKPKAPQRAIFKNPRFERGPNSPLAQLVEPRIRSEGATSSKPSHEGPSSPCARGSSPQMGPCHLLQSAVGVSRNFLLLHPTKSHPPSTPSHPMQCQLLHPCHKPNRGQDPQKTGAQAPKSAN